MGIGVDILHEVFFQLAPGERLSGRLTLDPWLAVLVPLCGGIIFGIASEVIARWRPEREVDPIEANALHGGRMSLIGSMIVAAQTMWSSGVGASVGLEAGYTQIASRHRLAHRPRLSPAPRRPAHPGRLRRRRRHCRRVRCAARRRVLRF